VLGIAVSTPAAFANIVDVQLHHPPCPASSLQIIPDRLRPQRHRRPPPQWQQADVVINFLVMIRNTELAAN